MSFSFLDKASVVQNLIQQFEKGQGHAQIGEIRVWHDGKRYQKVAPDKWVEYKAPKKANFNGNLVGPAKFGSPQFDPNLNAQVSTLSQYNNGSGWSRIRVERTHKPIVKSYKDRGKVNPNGKKTVILMMGAPASGKGTLQAELRKQGLIESHVVSIDPDEIKTEALKPDYDRFCDVDVTLAADKVHKESVHIAKMAFATMEKHGYDYLQDRCFANYITLKGEIDNLARQGYQIKIFMAKVPFKVAKDRMLERAKETKRYVPLNYMEAQYSMIDTAWRMLMRDKPKGVVSAVQYDTMDKDNLKILDSYEAKV